MTIREATSADAPYIKNLLRQLGYPDISVSDVEQKIRGYGNEFYTLLVAVEAEEITGFVSLHWFDLFHSPGKIGRISAFCIDEHSRGHGVGTKLLRAAEELFKANG